MTFKLLVLVALLAIVASLASGLYFLVHDRQRNDRTVRALTVRIGLSVALFIMLMLAYMTGLIRPHGL